MCAAVDASLGAPHFGGQPRPAKRTGAATARQLGPICCSRRFNSLSDSTESEEDGHHEIQHGADQRRKSECESGSNRKANVDKPVFVRGLHVLGAEHSGVLVSVAAWNYNGFPVRATLHGDYSDAELIPGIIQKQRHLFLTLVGHRQSLMQ